MICPKCNGETNVVDSRGVAQSVRRRRECTRCRARFTTFEVMSTAENTRIEQLIIVNKRDFADSIRGALEIALNVTLLQPCALESTTDKIPENQS